jgi:cytochrome c-type biogenesis protein CcmH
MSIKIIMTKYFILLITLMISFPTYAVDKTSTNFATPEQEQRFKNLIDELRCVVCQNQSLSDSNAALAQDLRDEVRSMVDKGLTDKEITDFLVNRYGDFVLYRPPLKPKTYILWIGPVILLLISIISMVYFIRRQKIANSQENKLTVDEQKQLKDIL